MSLLANHGVLRSGFAPISLVRSQVVGASGVDPATINVSGGAAADGVLMIMQIGGVQTRTVTPPAGWSSYHVPSVGAAGTLTVLYRIASSESGSYSIDLSSSMTPGAIYYSEWRGIDTLSPLASSVGNSTNSAGTSLASPSFSVMTPGLAYSACQHDSVTPQWQPNNSFTIITASSPTRAAYRIYAAADSSESVTWTGFSSTASKVGVLVFNAKRV